MATCRIAAAVYLRQEAGSGKRGFVELGKKHTNPQFQDWAGFSVAEARRAGINAQYDHGAGLALPP